MTLQAAKKARIAGLSKLGNKINALLLTSFRPVSSEQASKHIYLSNMTGYQKSHWLNNAGSTNSKNQLTQKQKTYTLATPHRHNITVIDAKECLLKEGYGIQKA